MKGLPGCSRCPVPALKGGYDFSFFAVFQGIGGTGFFMGAPSRVTNTGQDQRSFRLKEEFTIRVNRVRIALEKTYCCGTGGHSRIGGRGADYRQP